MDAISALLPVALILVAVAAGYSSTIVAVHAKPHLPAEDRFSVEIIAAVIMAVALAAAFAGGKTW